MTTRVFYVFFALSQFLLPMAFAQSHGIPFFKNPRSLFASGQASYEALTQRQLRSNYELRLRVHHLNKDYYIPPEMIVRDIELSKMANPKENLPLLKEPFLESSRVGKISPGTTVQILKVQGAWSFIEVPCRFPCLGIAAKGWVFTEKLNPSLSDVGYTITLIDSFLKKAPKIESQVITTVPKETRLQILQMNQGWALVQYRNYQGYLDLSHLILKADFAYSFADSNNQWHPVLRRSQEFFITPKGEKYKINEAKALATRQDIGIVIKADPPNWLLRQQLVIKEATASLWIQSQMNGHGPVWWKKSLGEILNSKTESSSTLLTEQLLEKEIHAMAFTSNGIGFISAQGIYRTSDGLHWKKLSQFGDKDYPITLSKEGVWWIGPYRSRNGGESFDQSIRWEQLARTVENHLRVTPRHLSITKVDVLNRKEVVLTVDTGIKMVSLTGNPDISVWRIVH